MVSERKAPIGMPPGGPGNKRHKGEGMPPEGMPGHGPMPRYPQGAYGGGPPPPGYPMGWQGQYGAPPPHGWQGQAPPPGMYPQRGGPPMTPERGYGYPRGPPPPHQPPPNGSGSKSTPRRNMKPSGKSQKTGGDNPMPPHQYGAYGGNPQWGPQFGGPHGPPPPPGQWGGHPPPPHMQQQYPNGWASAAQTPPRRPRASPEMMMGGPPRGSYPPSGGPGGVCPPVGLDASPPDGDIYVTSRGVGMHDDDGASSQGGRQSDKDKGRGSYKCGRCGVPKKGHVCPYQPKVKRRSGEPAPEMKSACVQVEMDEFMTLRRLNIRIQGFPESYAADPTLANMVVGEPRPGPMSSIAPNMQRSTMMPTEGPPMMSGPEAARSSPHPTSLQGSTIPAATLNEPTKG